MWLSWFSFKIDHEMTAMSTFLIDISTFVLGECFA